MPIYQICRHAKIYLFNFVRHYAMFHQYRQENQTSKYCLVIYKTKLVSLLIHVRVQKQQLSFFYLFQLLLVGSNLFDRVLCLIIVFCCAVLRAISGVSIVSPPGKRRQVASL